MSYARQLISVIVSLALASTVSAQNAPGRNQDAFTRLNLLIEPQLVRFTTPGEALDWRLEITDQQDKSVFDSTFVTGSTLEWPLVNDQGQPIESGLYDYKVSIRDGRGAVRIHRGQLTVERTSTIYRIAATGDESSADTILTVVSGAPEPAVAGTHAGTAPEAGSVRGSVRQTNLGPVTFSGPQPLISGSGTTGRMTKWSDGPSGVVADTQVTESNGAMVVGNGSFVGNVQIFGAALNDVFAGMGPDVINGPAFNYGYAGATFGRSAGFFNVRPDASATAPNPSLRFMTANIERMIVTNAGNVGIGVTTPNRRLQVVNAGGKNGFIQVGSQDIWSSNERRIIHFGDNACGPNAECVYVGEEDADDTLVLRSNRVVFKTFSDVSPESDSAVDLGGSATRWFRVFAANGTIQTSDRRLKRNIQNGDYGLTQLLQLRPVTFEWKDRHDERRYLGLIAQEVEPLIPEAIERGKDPDSPLGMNYASLIPVVVKAIQEQQITITTLESENAALKARLSALEQAMRELMTRYGQALLK